jgi:iron complex outermembrane receptor protein
MVKGIIMNNIFKLGTLALSVSLALASSTLYAAEEEEVNDDEVLVIVGSRSAPRSVSDSPVPIDVIGSEELSNNGSSDMLDMLQAAVPSFTARAQPISDAATLIRPINLRGLPSDSALLLVNGKRRHRASVIAFQGGGVNDGAQGADISVIPAVAIQQVEVLRDGASAQYGSDAIAGVLNFILKDDSEGGSFSIKSGGYAEGDGDSTIIDGNIGLPLTKDGFANFSFQYKNADATSRSQQRGDAQRLIDGGNTEVANPAQIWGNPEIEDDLTVFANIGLDLGGDKEFYLFGNYSERDVTGGFYYRNPHTRGNVYSLDGGQTLLVGNVSLADNDPTNNQTCAVVPANVPNVLNTQPYMDMVADPNCFSMNMVPGYAGGYTPQFGGNITDSSVTMGTRGLINSGILKDWDYDLSAAVGRNEASFNLKNTLNPSLGLSTPSDFETGSYVQLEKTFNFDLVKMYDNVNVATGVEWREESFQIVAGEESSWKAGPYADQGFNIGSHGFKGFGPESAGTNSRRNIGLYGDVEMQATDELLVGATLRYEDFSSFGSTTDYKLSFQYNITDDFSLRGSHSTGFRAPTVGQANVVNTQTSIINGNLVQTFIAPPTFPLAAFYGGKELTPEESLSYAFGAVYDNGDFFLTIDWYSIEVTDRLAQTSQISVDSADYAALRALGVANPELISAVTYYANDFDTTTEGVDIVANYSMESMGGNTMLSLAFNYNETNVDQFNPDTTSVGKVRRLEKGLPLYRTTFTVSQNWDDFDMFLRLNYFGEYFASHADDTSPWGSEVADSAITIDAQGTYTINDNFKVAVGAKNLFDQEAQRLKLDGAGDPNGGCCGGIYYESGPFDYMGAYYYASLTYTY